MRVKIVPTPSEIADTFLPRLCRLGIALREKCADLNIKPASWSHRLETPNEPMLINTPTAARNPAASRHPAISERGSGEPAPGGIDGRCAHACAILRRG